MDDPFVVEQVSETAAWALAFFAWVLALGTAFYTLRAFRIGLEDRWSAAVATLVMAALAGLLASDGAHVLPSPFSLWLLALWAVAVAFTLTYTLARIHDRIRHFQTVFGVRFNQWMEETLPEERRRALEEFRERWKNDFEGRRKAPHLVTGAFMLGYLLLGHWALRGIWAGTYGGTPQGGGEGVMNLHAAAYSDPGAYLVPGHVFTLILLLAVLFLLAITELLRLGFPETGYPFKAVILNNLRDKEAGLFGAHYYILAATAFAALWLGRDPATWETGLPAILAVIAVTVFADTASALLGMRFGRRKWPHNHGKSYVGTAAGTAVAFLVALPFTGALVAGASAVVFLIVDVGAPRPLPVSDNLLNPVLLAAAYTVMQDHIAPLMPFY